MPTYYRLTNCLDYYKSDLNGTIALEESAFIRADINSYLCPVALLPKFIQGTQFEETYVSTTLQLDVCQADGVKVCADEAVIQNKVDDLQVEMFFLDTNFDGSNITEPLFSYLDFSMKQGMAYGTSKVTELTLNSNIGILHDSYLGLDSRDTEYPSFFQLGSHSR